MGVRNSSISNHLWFIYYRERDREGEIVYGCEIDEFFERVRLYMGVRLMNSFIRD